MDRVSSNQTFTTTDVLGIVSALSSIMSFIFAWLIWRVYKQQRDIMRQQMEVAERQRRETVFMQLYFYLQDEQLRDARRKLRAGYLKVGTDPKGCAAALDREELERVASQVLSSFQLAARFIERDLIAFDTVRDFYGDTIIACFDGAPQEVQGYAPWASLRKLVSRLKEPNKAL